MKPVLLMLCMLSLTSLADSQQVPADSLYLGQKTPGKHPQLFPLKVLPGHFAAERIAVSPGGEEIIYSEIQAYYPVRGERLKRYLYRNNHWSGPEILFEGFIAPAFSLSGDSLYMQKDSETYLSWKKISGWSFPVKILPGLDSAHYYQKVKSGNQYLSSVPANGEGLFDWCILSSGADPSAKSLGKPLNTAADDFDFYVAPDESFMITTSPKGLAVSFHLKDGNWSSPINLGPEINFGLGMWGPCVSLDGKYLFYSTGTRADYSDVGVFWVKIDVLLKNINQDAGSHTPE
jgi:hypothetical protein